MDNSTDTTAPVLGLIWSQHPCHRRHRNEATFLRCAIPKLEWVHGTGPFALVAWCRVPTATLWDSYGEAARAKHDIDRKGCGGLCSGSHQIVRVVLPT